MPSLEEPCQLGGPDCDDCGYCMVPSDSEWNQPSTPPANGRPASAPRTARPDEPAF